MSPPNGDDTLPWFKDAEGVIWIGWGMGFGKDKIMRFYNYKSLPNIMKTIETELNTSFWSEDVDYWICLPKELINHIRQTWPHLHLKYNPKKEIAVFTRKG